MEQVLISDPNINWTWYYEVAFTRNRKNCYVLKEYRRHNWRDSHPEEATPGRVYSDHVLLDNVEYKRTDIG